MDRRRVVTGDEGKPAQAVFSKSSMCRRDYILRLIEQFGRALAVLLSRITGRQSVTG
jgi:hypothetical protein